MTPRDQSSCTSETRSYAEASQSRCSVSPLTPPRSQCRGDGTAVRAAAALERRDRLLTLERDADVVEAVEQAVLDLLVELELDDPAGEGDRLVVHVDPRLTRRGDLTARVIGQDHRQQSVLRAVDVEDVRERGCDDRVEPEVLNRP